MDIITNVIVNVNQAKTDNGEDRKINKYADKKKKSSIIVSRMIQINKKARAIRMNECSTLLEIGKCSCGTTEVLRANTCKDKLCPICNWRLSMKRYSEMVTITNDIMAKNPNITWSFITLTVKNSANLDTSLKEMNQAWKRLLQRKIIKENVIGTAKAVEITYNNKSNQFHPHFHVLVAQKNPIDINELWRVWRDVNYKLTVSAKAQNYQEITIKANDNVQDLTPAILETFKYSTKTSDLEEMPIKMFRRYVTEIAGKRMISFTGILKESRQVITNDTYENMGVCHSCGNNNLQHMLARWSFERQTYDLIKLVDININAE